MRISDWSSDVCSSDRIAQFGCEVARKENRHRALGAVEQHRRRRKPLAPGTQHIGRADTARPDPAQVARAEHPGQDNAERDRTQQITRENQRSEEHTSELQALMRITYAVFCLKKKKTKEQT